MCFDADLETNHAASLEPERVAAGPVATPPPAELFTTLYHELQRLARREVRRNGAADHVSTVTLVHEAWLEISDRPHLSFEHPNRFLAYAARTMRGLVIDRVRAKQAQKRGGGLLVTLDTAAGEQIAPAENLESIGEALDRLAELEPALAQIVELKFFCGFSLPEIAAMRRVSPRTVQRQWEKARLLLHRALAA